MRLFFVRHGQTEYNLKEIIQGYRCDSPLTPLGIQQAKQAGEKLKDIPFTAAYISPAGRAQQTFATLIAQNKKDQAPRRVLDARLLEINFGKYDGQKLSVMKEAGVLDAYRNHPEHFDKKTTGGEDYYDLEKRGRAALNDIVQQEPAEANILIVSHAVFLTTLLKRLMNYPMQAIRQEGLLNNASISVIDIDKSGHCSLLAYNE